MVALCPSCWLPWQPNQHGNRKNRTSVPLKFPAPLPHLVMEVTGHPACLPATAGGVTPKPTSSKHPGLCCRLLWLMGPKAGRLQGLQTYEVQPSLNPKGTQPSIFTGRTYAEVPILGPPDVKSRLIRKSPDARKD